MRDTFGDDVKRTVAARVGNRCSRPDCRAATTGPQVDSAKALNVGVAAHITAASPGGPRYDTGLSPEQRKSADNAIWLCQNCGKLVDNDSTRFSAALLRGWKQNAEAEAFACIGKPVEGPIDRTAADRLALLDARFRMVIDDYKVRGTPRFMIDTFVDLSREEKAVLYDRAVMWKKRRKSKNNPYVGSQ
jgi:hypothetical protein